VHLRSTSLQTLLVNVSLEKSGSDDEDDEDDMILTSGSSSVMEALHSYSISIAS
jgi:hypothetical protein